MRRAPEVISSRQCLMHSVITRTVVSGLTIELPALFFNVKNWLRIVALSTPSVITGRPIVCSVY